MEIHLSITLFALIAFVFVYANLTIGSLVRPWLPNDIKRSTYECGEIPIGNSWVQFDLRFYIIALVFLILAVEVALFYLWAVAYGSLPEYRMVALVDMLFFYGVVMVGYVYLWRFGYLDWVRSANTTSIKRYEAEQDKK